MDATAFQGGFLSLNEGLLFFLEAVMFTALGRAWALCSGASPPASDGTCHRTELAPCPCGPGQVPTSHLRCLPDQIKRTRPRHLGQHSKSPLSRGHSGNFTLVSVSICLSSVCPLTCQLSDYFT